MILQRPQLTDKRWAQKLSHPNLQSKPTSPETEAQYNIGPDIIYSVSCTMHTIEFKTLYIKVLFKEYQSTVQ